MHSSNYVLCFCYSKTVKAIYAICCCCAYVVRARMFDIPADNLQTITEPRTCRSQKN